MPLVIKNLFKAYSNNSFCAEYLTRSFAPINISLTFVQKTKLDGASPLNDCATPSASV